MATSLYRGLNFSDPFGLCPPQNNDTWDCGSTFFANRIAQGTGSTVLNHLGGWVNQCVEDSRCGSLLFAAIGAAAGSVRGGGPGLSQALAPVTPRDELVEGLPRIHAYLHWKVPGVVSFGIAAGEYRDPRDHGRGGAALVHATSGQGPSGRLGVSRHLSRQCNVPCVDV